MYHLLAILTMAIWGTTFVATKLLLMNGLSPACIFVLRFVLAYLGMAAAELIIHPHQRWRCANWKDEAMMAVAGITGGSMYFLTENTALEMAQASNVSLIVCLAPLVTALFARIVGIKETAGRSLWIGSIIAFVGVAFVSYGSTDDGEPTHALMGNLLALAAAALWAVYQIIVGPLATRYGTAMLTRKVFGYGLLTILPFVASEPVALLSTLARPQVWGNLLFLGIVASLLCYVAWNKVVEQLGSIVSANYIYLNPLVTCVASHFFLGEELTATMAVGGVAILVGLYLAAAPRSPKAKQPSTTL